MKRLSILIIGLLIIVSSSFAQTGKRNSAFSALQAGKLTKAKESIDLAILHKKTINDAKTWMYRGQIYIAIYESQSGGLLIIDAEALAKAEESLNRAKELDIENELGEVLENNFKLIIEKFYNKGADLYNKKEYKDAAAFFEKSVFLNDSFGIIDTAALYSGGLSHHFAGNSEKMEESFLQLLELKYQKLNIYLLLGERLADKNTEKAIEIINQGREIYPEDFSLVITAANIFLTHDRTEEALEALEAAIEMDNTNFVIYHNVGIMYDLIFTNEENTEQMRFNAFVKATEAYNQALEINPEYFESLYNNGAINFNKGVYFLTKADDLPLGDKNYDVYKADAEKCMVIALPFLERASTMQPEDINTLYSLKQIYSRIGDTENYKIVDAKLKALEL